MALTCIRDTHQGPWPAQEEWLLDADSGEMLVLLRWRMKAHGRGWSPWMKVNDLDSLR